MKIEDNNLKNKLKENPFSTPEGYLEGLTDRIMKQIPEETIMPEAEKVSLLDRLRLPALTPAIQMEETQRHCS